MSLYIYIYIYICVCVYSGKCQKNENVTIYIHIYIHIYIYIYIYIYISGTLYIHTGRSALIRFTQVTQVAALYIYIMYIIHIEREVPYTYKVIGEWGLEREKEGGVCVYIRAFYDRMRIHAMGWGWKGGR
jgi:hypothetical protein